MVSLQRYLQRLELLVEDPWSQNDIDCVLREVFQQVVMVWSRVGNFAIYLTFINEIT